MRGGASSSGHDSAIGASRPDVSPAGPCVCLQLRRTARAVTQLYDAALQPCGLRSTQLALLVPMAKAGRIGVSDLAQLLVIDPTTLSRSLRKLEAMDLIVIAAGSDRRHRLVRLSNKGRRVLLKALPHWKKIQQEVLSKLAESDWRELQASLEKVKRISLEAYAGLISGAPS
jgi:DNA-binding MarR family transcriptional regulator